MKTEGSSSEKHFKLAAEELKGVGKRDMKGFQPVLKKKEFIFRVGARGYSKMSQRSIYTEKNIVADERKKGEYLPMLAREEYMSLGRKTSHPRQRYEEKTSIHPRDMVYTADGNKNEFYWQKEKRYNSCSGDKVITPERAQQRNLAALERKRRVAKPKEIVPVFPEHFQFAVNFPFGPVDVYEMLKAKLQPWRDQEFGGWHLRGNKEIPDWVWYTYLFYK
ncbi:hypothetical protein QYM36_015822 [Artemia franciscana]|uniref:Uncharacterized protein n=1 Tax=Artemia franciscana TaxID=6661 RepID=A0AA88HHQ3_ARTSF|nr:hypothetical protein QYM36_015822 [Artemia franciscana]